MHPTTGGYILTRNPLIRTGFAAHTTALDRPVSEADIAAINTIQETPWRINGWLLDVMATAWDTGHPAVVGALTEGMKPADRALVKVSPAGTLYVPQATRLQDSVWESLSEESRKAHTQARRERHGVRATLEGRQQALLDRLMVAHEMRGYERIWYPHTKDFRGRIYPLPVAGPHPQGDDAGKALLHFAEGLSLGPDGEFWLYVRAANCFGMDKLTLEERVGWTLENLENCISSAKSPLEYGWWTTSAEPWSFLATCSEISQMVSSSCASSDFVSHLPIPMDGSCNGLQHLSAMGLDPIGAKATNLTPGDRQDIYEEVAAHVRAKVEANATAGVKEALAWSGKVTRSVAKRSVLSTPYGVTDGGIRTQLIADGHVPADGADKGPAADYLRDCLVDALSSSVHSARAIMAWLQAVATKLADAGLPFSWTTPTGSRCLQAYTATATTRVRTLCGMLQLAAPVEGGMLLPRKQALGSAPNLVHSFDAAHLAMTVNEAHKAGVNSFAMIHDSYGTHARHTTLLARVLREQFVAIYEKDWLRELYEELHEAHPHVDLPEPPKRGDLDIRQVLDAPFFFS